MSDTCQPVDESGRHVGAAGSDRGAILIVIDGCRADALECAAVPHLRRLMELGAYTMRASTVIPSLTLPVHFSMFTSLPPEEHHVLTNADRPQPAAHARSIIEVAGMAGKKTAAFYNWENLRDLSLPGFLNYALYISNGSGAGSDDVIAGSAGEHIVKMNPDLCFVYLGGVDELAHRCGFMSDEYFGGIESADRAVGVILESLERHGLHGRYNLLILSDHGGAGHSHRATATSAEILTVPWILAGPDIRQGVSIKASVTVLDTAPMLARLLKLTPDSSWQGRILEEALK